MDFAHGLRVLARRWRVSVPVLLIAIAAAFGAFALYPTTYQSTAQISLISSKTMSAQPGMGGNPYLAVGGLQPMAEILAANLSSGPVVDRLKAQGVTDAYTAAVPPFTSAPFVAITASGKDPAHISRSMDAIIRYASQELRQMQERTSIRTPAAGLVSLAVIAQPSTPAPSLKTKIEVVAGVALTGLLAAFLLSFAAEARSIRRRQAGRFRPSAEAPSEDSDQVLTAQ